VAQGTGDPRRRELLGDRAARPRDVPTAGSPGHARRSVHEAPRRNVRVLLTEEAFAKAKGLVRAVGPARALFVDTGPLIAAYDLDDKHHARTLETWRRVRAGDFVAFTSDLVFTELCEALDRRRLTDKVRLAFREIVASGVPQLVVVPASGIETGISVLGRAAERQPNPQKRIGYVDAVNVAVMRALGIGTIFTTDGDYASEGVSVLP
jgi:predicted nucleic acid-binding protein